MMSKNSTIQFILTGGTIDSFYDGLRDTVIPMTHSSIPSFVKSLKLYEKIEFTEICMKDSRALTKKDLKEVLYVIENSSSLNIIITHGTYTMSDTARYLKANLKRKDQKIILTGSMIPLVGFAPSDAPFNLGFAIAKIKELETGIYVSMNGRIFSPEEVVKFLKEGRFISVFGENK